MALRNEKVVSVLPSTLIADTVYYVRTGAGFDIYVTDQTGTTAHKINNTAPVQAMFGISDAQAVTSTSLTPLNLTAEYFKDTGITHDVASNATRITVDAAGRYKLTGLIGVSDTATSNYRYGASTAIRVNGGAWRDSIVSGYIRRTTGHNQTSIEVFDVVELAAGDYIEIGIARETTTAGAATTLANATKVLLEKV